MGKFILLLKQRNEGCDFAIGCGISVRELKAETLEGARFEAETSLLDEDCSYYTEEGSDHELSSAAIASLELEIDLAQVRDKHASVREAEKKRQKDAIDLQLYAQLKKKYEGA